MGGTMALRGEAAEINMWKGRLSAAQGDRKHVEQDWARTIQNYELQLTQNQGKVHVNLSFPSVKILLRSAASSNPYIYVNPTRPEFVLGADALEFLLNDHWRAQNRKKILRRIVLDALLMKVGYGLNHLKPDPETGEHMSYLTRVSPAHLWKDGALDVADSYYVIRKIIMPWSKAKKLWPNARIPPVSPGDIYGDLERATGWIFANLEDTDVVENNLMDRCIVYEVHNQLDGEINVFHPQHDRYLVKPRPSPYPTQSLFTQLVFNEKVFQHYGISDLEVVEGQQVELDGLRNQMQTHNKRFNRKYKTARDNLNVKDWKALESSEDGTIVEMADPEAFDVIEDAPLSGDVYAYHAIIKEDYREILGINEYDRAGAVPRTKTAYETAQIVRGTQERRGEKADLANDFVVDISRKDIAIMKVFYDTNRVVRLLGPQGYAWEMVRQTDLQGVHRVTVQAGSLSPRDETADFTKGTVLYNIFGNDPNVDPMVLRDICTRLMNVPFRTKLLRRQPLSREAMGGQGQNQPGVSQQRMMDVLRGPQNTGGR
jgi:hypothetical protein